MVNNGPAAQISMQLSFFLPVPIPIIALLPPPSTRSGVRFGHTSSAFPARAKIIPRLFPAPQPHFHSPLLIPSLLVASASDGAARNAHCVFVAPPVPLLSRSIRSRYHSNAIECTRTVFPLVRTHAGASRNRRRVRVGYAHRSSFSATRCF